MRNTNRSNEASAPHPVHAPSWNSTEITYESSSAGNITKKMIRRASRCPKIRTVRSVARKMNGKLSAPQVECTTNPLGSVNENGNCTR